MSEPSREYSGVQKIVVSKQTKSNIMFGNARILGNDDKLLGVEDSSFITTAIHGFPPPKTTIAVEKGETIVEFGGAINDPYPKVVCRVWPRGGGTIIACHVAGGE